MSDKPQPENGDFFAIPDIAILSLEGRDALAFAQSQCMSDVNALTDGHWHWSGWLTPKGRVVALFALLRHSGESLTMLLLDAGPEAFVAQLQRFVFRSKVTIRIREDLHATGAWRAPAAARGAHFVAAGDALELDAATPSRPRTLRIGPAAPADTASADAWQRLDLAHGLPRLQAPHEPQWTPQQLSLDRLKAYSVKKGCYPGQEIVARTHFLGQAKRGLARLQGKEVHAPGEVMPANGERALGQIVCAAGGEALAVMPLDAGDGPFLVAGQPVVRLPLLDGLAR